MSEPPTTRVVDLTEPDDAEILAVSRGMATAIAPEGGITEAQASVMRAITLALTATDVDYRSLDPLTASELCEVLADRPLEYRRRIVHHMVLGELVLRPLPVDVARRVTEYSCALGIDDEFVGVARRYAQGAFGLAWVDLHRSGFGDRWGTSQPALHTNAVFADPFHAQAPDDGLVAKWQAFAELPAGTLGRSISDMYDERGFAVPGDPHGAPAFLAQHDFVHVIADYGTRLDGELEVFGLIGRADPDPKGFAWLATMVGLFESGFVPQEGFFRLDLSEHHLDDPCMGTRLADAVRRGKAVAEGFGTDLFLVDYHALAERDLDDVRAHLRMPPKSSLAVAAGSPGVFDPEGMTEHQRAAAAEAHAVAAD